MDYTTALAGGPDLFHNFRAVDVAESLSAEEVFPNVVDGTATRPGFGARALGNKQEKFLLFSSL